MKTKDEHRDKRRASIRKRVAGSEQRPRLAVFRSLSHIYAQVIDDEKQQTLAATSSLDPAFKAELKGIKKKDVAKRVGVAIAKACLAKGIDKVVFDRGGYLYHGRVSALAEGAREGGLKF
jgi:large subunit ribosomal protein L18